MKMQTSVVQFSLLVLTLAATGWLQAAEPKARDGNVAEAYFGAGCFWATEGAYEQLKGVTAAESGYAGGSKDTATYDRVSKGDTGHAEAVKVTYDPQQITYDQLLDVFFTAHDPTQLNRQGADEGVEYRSVIFVADEAQKKAAQAKIDKLTKAHKFAAPIVTKLESFKAFYPGEAYHQDYAAKHPDQAYIRSTSLPKIEKVKKAFPEWVK